ncbi:ABC transporter substrate-binding protein [Aquincola sp. S2]|uniref:ABC transporter substrate-binding protein n=1 Tax=Pseudaquabacterium terrae TaxID=2732868 RepID=A0ABX2ELW6_9BURK|nr:ABC transporter substrate-binding protein [Aquabacterium terrae]NRF69651.1 ABC transporter substrate-binding protein [Aquabacterium terrae]
MPTSLQRRTCLAGLGALAASPWTTALAQAPAGDIVIGQSAHLSGPLSATFKAVVRGQELALEEFNRRGGVGGRKVKLVTLDDAYDPKRCVENVNLLIERDKAVALFGLASTANVGAVLPILTEKKVPLVGVYTGAPALRAKQHPYFFTAMASYRDEVVQMIRNLATVGRTKLAVAYHASPFGQLMLPVVEEVCKELGSALVAKAALDIPGQESVAVVQTLAAAQPQAVLFIAFGPALVPFVKAARAQLGVPVYALSIASSKPLLDALGDEARGLAFTQTLPYAMRATSTLTRDYAAAMERARLPIDFDHFFGYLNLRVLLELLKRAGRALTSQSLVSTIEGLGKVDLGGYTLNFGPQNHHGSNFVDLLIVGPGGRFIR